MAKAVPEKNKDAALNYVGFFLWKENISKTNSSFSPLPAVYATDPSDQWP